MDGDSNPPAPITAATPHDHGANAPESKAAPPKSFLSSVTRGGLEKALITGIGFVFGGALLYYLNAFKQNQDAMMVVLTAEHGPAWPKSTPDHVSIHDLWQTEEELRKQIADVKEQTQKSDSRINNIVHWGEQLRTRMASWGTNDRYGKANLTNAEHSVIYVNTRNAQGGWFKTGEAIILTNRHHGAQGPEFSGNITSAYVFPDEGPDSNVLVQISRDVAAELKLPLQDGVFDVSIRKAQAVPFVPGVEEGTKP
jgi:hypothetical protein